VCVWRIVKLDLEVYAHTLLAPPLDWFVSVQEPPPSTPKNSADSRVEEHKNQDWREAG
jgi:hypothetical protein